VKIEVEKRDFDLLRQQHEEADKYRKDGLYSE